MQDSSQIFISLTSISGVPLEPLELELELGWGVGMGTAVVNAVPWLNQQVWLVLLFKGLSIDPESWASPRLERQSTSFERFLHRCWVGRVLAMVRARPLTSATSTFKRVGPVTVIVFSRIH